MTPWLLLQLPDKKILGVGGEGRRERGREGKRERGREDRHTDRQTHTHTHTHH